MVHHIHEQHGGGLCELELSTAWACSNAIAQLQPKSKASIHWSARAYIVADQYLAQHASLLLQALWNEVFVRHCMCGVMGHPPVRAQELPGCMTLLDMHMVGRMTVYGIQHDIPHRP